MNTYFLPLKDKKVNMNIYKLLRPTLRIGFVFLYLISFIIILFLLKLYKSFRIISLKQLYIAVLQFFSYLDLGQQVCTVLFLLTLVYLAILLTKRVKILIFNELIKVHLYLQLNKTYLDYVILPVTLYCHMTLQIAIISFLGQKFTRLSFLNKGWFFNFIGFLVDYLGLILILFFVVFDIWFNDYVLTKVFYILPFCFLYSQWLYISNFITSKDIFLDDWIQKYLYTKIFFEDESIIIFEDGSAIDLEMRLAIDQYIKKGFRAY